MVRLHKSKSDRHTGLVTKKVAHQPEATTSTQTLIIWLNKSVSKPITDDFETIWNLLHYRWKTHWFFLLILVDNTITTQQDKVKRTIEISFGALLPRRKAPLSPIHTNPENTAAVVKAAVVLRSFMKMHDGSLRKGTRLSQNELSRSDILKNYLKNLN